LLKKKKICKSRQKRREKEKKNKKQKKNQRTTSRSSCMPRRKKRRGTPDRKQRQDDHEATTIGGLHEELIAYVLHMLPAENRTLCRFVCRRWASFLPAPCTEDARSLDACGYFERSADREEGARRDDAMRCRDWCIQRGCPWTPDGWGVALTFTPRRHRRRATPRNDREPDLHHGLGPDLDLDFDPDHGLGSDFDLDPDVGRLLCGDDVLAYKVVDCHIATAVGSRFAWRDVTALLTLQIPAASASVYSIEGDGDLCPMAELKPATKYCTSMARVLGVRFAGAPLAVNQVIGALCFGRLQLLSKHTVEFEYRLGEDVFEPAAGRGCGKRKCGEGIYFYLDERSALEYASGEISCAAPVITARVPYRHAVVLSFGGEDEGGSDDGERALAAETRKRRHELDAWLRVHVNRFVDNQRGDDEEEEEDDDDDDDDDDYGRMPGPWFLRPQGTAVSRCSQRLARRRIAGILGARYSVALQLNK
jgi:hypothetical protein